MEFLDDVTSRPTLTGKWVGEYTAGTETKRREDVDGIEGDDGRDVHRNLGDRRTGTQAIKGVRTGATMAFSLSYQHPKLGPAKCDVEGKITDGGKTLKIKYTESWKEKKKTKTDQGEAILKRE